MVAPVSALGLVVSATRSSQRCSAGYTVHNRLGAHPRCPCDTRLALVPARSVSTDCQMWEPVPVAPAIGRQLFGCAV